MMNRGLAIKYGDIAPEAKENFYIVPSEMAFYQIEQLKRYNVYFPNYANPCELYQTVLDGTAIAFPSVPENANLGLWSERISNENGLFAEPIELELTSIGQYSSQGLTLTFDTYNNIFATRVGIKWSRITNEGKITLAQEEFTPDNAFYFCQKKVENYNDIVITFYSINMPKNRLKLRAIDYGYGTIIYGEELRNTNIIQELDPISTQISINTVDFSLDSKTDIEYFFQKKQPLSVYFDGQLKATTFVKSAKRKSKFLWEIQSEDYIGVMDGMHFYGGMYNGKDAYELFEEIFAVAKVPYTINENLKGILLYGHIPFTTCRNALMQVAFAVQNVVDTSGREDVEVFELDTEVKQTVSLNRIKQGQNFVDDEIITSVEVSAHNYKPISEVVNVYNANESGAGRNIFVKFSEPLHDLSIINGEFVSMGTNYAIIDAEVGCVLTGQRYKHTVQTYRKQNPIVSANDVEKIVSIENATLVSRHNIDNILEKCYNWLIKTNTINLDIVERKHVKYGDYIKYGQKKYGAFKYGEKHPNIVTYDEPVNVGDTINAETEYLGIANGIITKQIYNLNGNILVKKAVLK